MAELGVWYVAVAVREAADRPQPVDDLIVYVGRDPSEIMRVASRGARACGLQVAVFEYRPNGGEEDLAPYFYVDRNGGTGPFPAHWGEAEDVAAEAVLCARSVEQGEWEGREVYHVERA
jgi:hypothetical protein